MSVRNIITIAQLTLLEMRRRRLVLAALACGAALLVLFALAVYLLMHGPHPLRSSSLLQMTIQLQLATLAGLSCVNLLTVAVAILLPIDTLSGEIASGVMQTLASKPVRRGEIVLGKWLVFWLMSAAFIVFLVAGVVLAMRLITGFSQPHVLTAAGLMVLQASVLLGVVMMGSARLTTITTGVVAFGYYCIAVIGGLIEQIGVMMGSTGARHIGTVISLVSPTDAVWRRALHLLQPPVMAEVSVTPFAGPSVPSVAMVWWAVGFALGALLLAMRWFGKRAL